METFAATQMLDTGEFHSWMLQNKYEPITPFGMLLQYLSVPSSSPVFSNMTGVVGSERLDLPAEFTAETVNGYLLTTHLFIIITGLFLKDRLSISFIAENILSGIRTISKALQKVLNFQWAILTAALIYHCVYVCNYSMDGNDFIHLSVHEWAKNPEKYRHQIMARTQGEFLLFETFVTYGLTYALAKFDSMYDSYFRISILAQYLINDITSVIDFYCLSHYVIYYKSGDALVIAMFMAVNMLIGQLLNIRSADLQRVTFSKSMLRNFCTTILDFHMISAYISNSPSYPVIRYIIYLFWFLFLVSAMLVSFGAMLTWFVVSAGFILPDSLQRRSVVSGLNVSNGEVNQLQVLSQPFNNILVSEDTSNPPPPSNSKEDIMDLKRQIRKGVVAEAKEYDASLEAAIGVTGKGSSDMGARNIYIEFCAVCKHENRSIILLPCKCLCMCDECRSQMASYGYDKCPTCNQIATSYLKINRP